MEAGLDTSDLKLIAFDLDDTLAHSKSAVDRSMVEALMRLLDHFQVLVISGGRFQQFEHQLLNSMDSGPALERLHLMPTCGTRYVRWQAGKWQRSIRMT